MCVCMNMEVFIYEYLYLCACVFDNLYACNFSLYDGVCAHVSGCASMSVSMVVPLHLCHNYVILYIHDEIVFVHNII